MGFLPEQNKAIVLIPKTGTKTIKTVAGQLGAFEYGNDHKTFNDLRDYIRTKHPELEPDTEYAVNIRHPVERFISGLHFCYKNPHPMFTLDFILEQQHREKFNDFIFRPQSEWIEGCDNIRLFKFDTMDICRWVGWKEDEYVPQINAVPRRFSRKEVEAHPLFNTFMDRYEADWQLWKRVL